MNGNTLLKGMTFYTIIIAVIIIMVYLLPDGKNWMVGPMYDQGNNRHNLMGMGSNHN